MGWNHEYDENIHFGCGVTTVQFSEISLLKRGGCLYAIMDAAALLTFNKLG